VHKLAGVLLRNQFASGNIEVYYQRLFHVTFFL